jgi:pimeloyl-ACP methyl ester carboxylesterase
MRALAALAFVLAAAVPSTARAASPLQPCSVGDTAALCATVSVPESRALADGRSIGLRVAVLPATEKPVRPDPLFYVVGGPGAAATADLPGVASVFAQINGHRDIVFVDQRGVGGSNPLACAIPTSTFTGTVADFVRGCILATGADVTHYRTPDAVDDLDAVRQALGYGKIDLYGVSYGGTFVQVYLNRHPETVRAAVLDSATLLDIPVFERWASNAERALKLLHKRCSADRLCAHAFPVWYERFPDLLAGLSQRRRHVRVGAYDVVVDAASTSSTIAQMTASALGAAQVPFALARAEAGKLRPLAQEIARQGEPAGPIPIMPRAILCTEPWAAWDPARAWADAKSTYLRYSWLTAAYANQQVCDAWPKVDTGAEDWTRPGTALPVLALVGGADPKDPIGNVAGIQKAMPNSRVVVVPGQAHGVAAVGCMPFVVADFLERGSVKRLDTSCVSLIATPAFRLR